MHYVLTGGAGNITKPLALNLLKAGHAVTVIGRSEANLAPLTAAGAKAAIGEVEDIAFLTTTFTGADAVYLMIPPKWDAADWKGYIAGIGSNYAAAVKSAGVKKVVLLSSVGAHLPAGCGPVTGLHRVEEIFKQELAETSVKILRPAYFYNNLLANVGMVKHAGIIGSNFGGDIVFPIVDPADIADAATEELLRLDFTGHTVRYIASDEVTGNQIAAALGSAIQKPQLPWITFTNEQSIEGMKQAGLSDEVASNYTEMGEAMNGPMGEDYFASKTPVFGKTKLADFAPVFAQAYGV